MSEKQYVQHISGQGEKWELSGKLYNQEDNKDWQVIAKRDPSPFNYHYLPKSEYRLCPAPEVWRDVTEDCEVRASGIDLACNGDRVSMNGGYRLRKVQAYQVGERAHVFIVEQKVKP